jgi:glycosyltransferase involved in cell wall biosynthesis
MKVKTHTTDRWNAGPHVFLNLYKKHSKHQFVEGKDCDALFLVFANETGYRSKYKYKKVVTRCDGLYCLPVPGKDSKRMNGQALMRYKWADGVVFQSQYCKALYEHYTGRPVQVPHKIIINGTDVPFTEGERFPAVLCNTASRDIKRSHMITAVAAKLGILAKGVKFYIIGDCTIRGPNIVSLGQVPKDKLLGYYSSCTTFLHTAYRDSCPNSVVEACAAGMVVVGSESGGVPDIVQDKGLLFHEKCGRSHLTWMDQVPDPDVDEIARLLLDSFLMRGWHRPDLSAAAMAAVYDNFLEEIGRHSR